MQSENALENKIVRYVKSVGGRALKLILAAESGFPDRTILLPNGIVLFLEIKKKRGAKVYPMQEAWQERIQHRQITSEFVDDFDKAKSIIDDALQWRVQRG